MERALVRAGLVQPGFFNSWALNLYHDGSEGIQSHYDDPDRFEQPIYSLRLFSDSRLSFGTQLYGYAAVPAPCKGCVIMLVLTQSSACPASSLRDVPVSHGGKLL